METYHVEITGTATTVYAVEASSPQEAVQKAAKEGKVVNAHIVDPHCTSVYQAEPAEGATHGSRSYGRSKERRLAAFERQEDLAGTYELAQQLRVEARAKAIVVHEYVASYSGMCCAAMVVRDGFGDACGLPAGHGVHQEVERERLPVTWFPNVA